MLVTGIPFFCMKHIVLSLFLLVGAGSAMAQGALASASLTPNPVETRATLVFAEPLGEQADITVRDLTGHVVWRVPFSESMMGVSSVLMPLEHLQKGVYLCQIALPSGKTRTLRFQKL